MKGIDQEFRAPDGMMNAVIAHYNCLLQKRLII